MSIWSSNFGKTLRWILFLPIGVILAVILETLLLGFVNFAAAYQLKTNLLTAIILLLTIAIGLPVTLLYIVAVVNLPRFVCGRIAPSQRISSVVLGLFFLICQTITLLGQIGNTSKAIIFAKVLFSFFFLVGTVFAFFEPRERSA
jgi:hypothetical protein